MNRIRSDGRFACPLAEFALTEPNLLTKAANSGVRRWIALGAAMVGLVVPLAVALPATASPVAAGTGQPDMVTQWNLTMIAGLEAAAIPPPPAARIGATADAQSCRAADVVQSWHP